MYESYQTIKIFHVLVVSISLTMFIMRSGMMLLSIGNYKHRLWRLLTAFNDTVLLVLGAYLTYINSGIWHMPWFQEKMLFLLLYIILGTLALNRLQAKLMRRLCLIVALGCAIHMLQLAVTKNAFFFQ